ncbi:hypothetical protein [Streptomyces nojiriensis]|uniref:hypothetical protein n=1 Tax=Streptomyces nojiriensis TaxID=66374 RepID=UPI0036803559
MLGKHAVNAHLLLGRRPVLIDAGTPYRPAGRPLMPYLPTGPMGRLMNRNRKLHVAATRSNPGS